MEGGRQRVGVGRGLGWQCDSVGAGARGGIRGGGRVEAGQQRERERERE